MLAACSGQNVYDKGVGIMNLKQSLAGGAACVLASATLLWAGAAAAVNSDGYDIPSIGAGYNYEIPDPARDRSEEHTSELQSLMRSSYAVFSLTKKKTNNTQTPYNMQR